MKRIKKFSESFSKNESVNEGVVEDLLKKMGYENVDELKKQKNIISKLESLVRELNKENEVNEEGEESEEEIDTEIKDLGDGEEGNDDDKDDKEEKSEDDIDVDVEGDDDKVEIEDEDGDNKDETKSKKILSFDDFVADKINEAKSYKLKRIVEKYKVINEKLTGHAKKMKEDGVSDEEIKKMHPEVSDEDLEEGNAFTAARAKAIANGDSEFEVDGKTYPLEDVDKEDKENAEEFVGESLNEAKSHVIVAADKAGKKKMIIYTDKKIYDKALGAFNKGPFDVIDFKRNVSDDDIKDLETEYKVKAIVYESLNEKAVEIELDWMEEEVPIKDKDAIAANPQMHKEVMADMKKLKIKFVEDYGDMGAGHPTYGFSGEKKNLQKFLDKYYGEMDVDGFIVESVNEASIEIDDTTNPGDTPYGGNAEKVKKDWNLDLENDEGYYTYRGSVKDLKAFKKYLEKTTQLRDIYIQESVNEAKINSDKEFEEYAMKVLQKAFGDEFDEAKAKETIDGLKSKYKDDYGAMVGALTSGLGESINEQAYDYKVGDIVIFPPPFGKNKLKKHYMEVISVLDKRGAVPDQELTVILNGKKIKTLASEVELIKKG